VFYDNLLYRMTILESYAEDPKGVVDAVEKTIRAKNPPIRQVVGSLRQKWYAWTTPAQMDYLVWYFWLRGIKPLSKL